jgi:hypothetical protein
LASKMPGNLKVNNIWLRGFVSVSMGINYFVVEISLADKTGFDV